MGSEEIDETPTDVLASGGDRGRLGQRNHQLVDGASPGKGMCFCTLGGRGRKLLTGDGMTRWDARRMIVRRAKNRKAPGLVLVSIHVRADFSVRGGSSRGDTNPSRTLGGVTRYRWFESGSLQRQSHSQ